MSPAPKLTQRQRAYAQEYIIDLNGTQAAIRAGYTAKTARSVGTTLLANPSVCKAIADALAVRSARVQRTADDVLRDLGVVRADAMRVVDATEGLIDRPAALKSLELEGKHLAMFTDKLSISGEVLLRNMSDADLAAKLARLRQGR